MSGMDSYPNSSVDSALALRDSKLYSGPGTADVASAKQTSTFSKVEICDT